jgi:hypothetical protein
VSDLFAISYFSVSNMLFHFQKYNNFTYHIIKCF